MMLIVWIIYTVAAVIVGWHIGRVGVDNNWSDRKFYIVLATLFVVVVAIGVLLLMLLD
jgi:hypothetical protein